MSTIAERVDVNTARIYKYFPRGKADIVLSVGVDVLDKTSSSIDVGASDSPRDLLKGMIRQTLTAHRRHSTILKALEAEYLSMGNVYNDTEFAALTEDSETALRFLGLIASLGLNDSDILHEAC